MKKNKVILSISLAAALLFVLQTTRLLLVRLQKVQKVHLLRKARLPVASI